MRYLNLLAVVLISWLSITASVSWRMPLNGMGVIGPRGLIQIQQDRLLVDGQEVCPVIINPKDGYKDYPENAYKEEKVQAIDYRLDTVQSIIAKDIELDPLLKARVYADGSLESVMLSPIIRSLCMANLHSFSYADSLGVLHDLNIDLPLDSNGNSKANFIEVRLLPDSIILLSDEYAGSSFYLADNAIAVIQIQNHGSMQEYAEQVAKLIMAEKAGPHRIHHIWINPHPKTKLRVFEFFLRHLAPVLTYRYMTSMIFQVSPYPDLDPICICAMQGYE